MTVERDTEISVFPDDFYIKHRGIEAAIKVFYVSADAPGVCGVVKNASGAWEWSANLDDQVFWNSGHSPMEELAAAGGAVAWVKKVIVPAANAWLAKLFPPVAAPAPAPAGTPKTDLEALQQIDAVIGGLKAKLVIAADGTVKVVA